MTSAPTVTIESGFFGLIRESCAPALWSQAVQLTRSANFQIESATSADEIAVRLIPDTLPSGFRVTLWPADQTWTCSCTSEDDPCVHVAATAIAINKGQAKPRSAEDGPALPDSLASAEIAYAFGQIDGKLSLERFVLERNAAGVKRIPLEMSLLAYAGGVRSGRIPGKNVSATQEDFALDQLLPAALRHLPASTEIPDILRLLLHQPNVELAGKPVAISLEPLRPIAIVTREPKTAAYRVRLGYTESIELSFANGAVFDGKMLRARSPLPARAARLVTEPGTVFSNDAITELFAVHLPELSEVIEIRFENVAPPTTVPAELRISIEDELTDLGHSLLVTAHLEYVAVESGRVLGELVGGGLRLPDSESSTLELPERNIAAERSARQRIKDRFGLMPGQSETLTGAHAARAVADAADWHWTGEAHRLFVPVDPVLAAELGGDAFELVARGGSKAAPVELERILAAWERGEQFIQLSDQSWMRIPADWLRAHADAARDLLLHRSGTTRSATTLSRAAQVQLLDELGIALPEAFSDLRDRLHGAAHEVPFSPPPDLRAELRHYQQDGVQWLAFLKSCGFGAILADDMGLGKTLQAIAVCSGKTLVVAPTSVMYSWEEQLSQFRPTLTCSVYHGAARQLRGDADVTITSYGILRSDVVQLEVVAWDTIIIDEAQAIKNPHSLAAQAVLRLQGTFRIALSGTPIENSAQDIWSVSQFANPGLFGTLASFQEKFVAPISSGEATALQRLRKRIKPFLKRRLKSEVAKELPPKTSVVLHCELSDAERGVYQTVLAATRKEVLGKLDEGASVFSILESLLRLRQVCCYPALVPGVELRESAKLTAFIESVSEAIAAGHRALVFSQWTSLLDVVQERLRENHFEFLRLDGQTKNRQELIQQFQSESGPPVFLLSLKAGGAGITLTAADHVYLLDPWWNPAVEEQAADRAHRIGQDKPVLIHRLLARNTVEDKIAVLQERKALLAQAITEGTQSGDLKLTREDLLALLD